ncbi:MAG: peptide-methionine (S)-S-oxide reductase MsrA [Planctomycetota bacterium]
MQSPFLTTNRVVRLAALAMLLVVSNGCSAEAQDKPATKKPARTIVSDTAESKSELVATFAGGCFWCTEAVFERMEGVGDVVSGYIGGHVINPTYREVCSATTGHAEAVEIYYDPEKTTYEELMEVFFKTHDPTTLNRQGADAGPQYRSSIFYHNEEQKKAAEKYIQKLDESGAYADPIVTKLEKATKFFTAEEYHQDYFRKNPNEGYCRAVVAGKVQKFNELFQDKAKR